MRAKIFQISSQPGRPFAGTASVQHWSGKVRGSWLWIFQLVLSSSFFFLSYYGHKSLVSSLRLSHQLELQLVGCYPVFWWSRQWWTGDFAFRLKLCWLSSFKDESAVWNCGSHDSFSYCSEMCLLSGKSTLRHLFWKTFWFWDWRASMWTLGR